MESIAKKQPFHKFKFIFYLCIMCIVKKTGHLTKLIKSVCYGESPEKTSNVL